MAADPLSPIAPVRLRALLLPVGKIKRSRFLNLAERLQAENIVRLGDVTPPDGRGNRSSFSPLAFPAGFIIYDISTAVAPTSHLQLFPFETFREPLVIIAISDGAEFDDPGKQEPLSPEGRRRADKSKAPEPEGFDELVDERSLLGQKYPNSLIQQLLVFDFPSIDTLVTGPNVVIWVPRPDVAKSTTIKTVMCDITSLILGSLDKFVDNLRELSSIDSPKASSWGPRQIIDQRLTDKVQHRMTMPAQLPSKANGSVSYSSESKLQSENHVSPTTFDEITRSIDLANRATESVKSGSPKVGSKEHSRDRQSVQGLGQSNTSDRTKSRMKSRFSVVLGTLYLQTGRWPDSLRELVEGAISCRTNADYVWHAKALELIVLSLLMLGWVGMDFQIPAVCYPTPEKSGSKPSTPTPSASNSEVYNVGQPNPANRPISLQKLATQLPDILNLIVNLYMRSANIADEPLPQLIFSETIIRLSKILATIYVRDGLLDDDALGHIVLNKPLKLPRDPDRAGTGVTLRKVDIATFLFRALPVGAAADIPVTDYVPILVGIVSVLSSLRLDRKMAFAIKELFSILIPGLVQARKIGAAEVGMHPAAGLSALNNSSFEINPLDVGYGNMEESIRNLLSFLCEAYGIPSPDRKHDHAPTTSESSAFDSVDAIADRTFTRTMLDAHGDLRMKIDVLKACINFCEALPDFAGVLHYTVELLKTIRTTAMLPSDGFPLTPPTLSPEEQTRLFNNIQRTVSAASRLGAGGLEADYWDDFLVRDVELLNPSDSNEPVLRTKSDFISSTIINERTPLDPFIYNPFAKKATIRSEPVLIANEQPLFKVTLQNPYEFAVEIDSLRLEADGVALEAATTGLWLAPLSLQEKVIVGSLAAEGTLTITGCVAKVKYCRERKFPIFKNMWRFPADVLLKRTSLIANTPQNDRSSLPLSSATARSGTGATLTIESVKGPEAATMSVTVIRPQPVLVVRSASLSQSAIMVLEGETSSFVITVENISTCSVDLIHFSFQDSTTGQLQSALNNKGNLPADIYELELQLATNPALRWRCNASDDSEVSIQPRQSASYTVEVFGKPGLHEAVIQIDYANLGVAPSEMPETFYTRQITIPLAITVNASVDIARCDVLTLTEGYLTGLGDDRKFEEHGNAMSMPNGEVGQPEAKSTYPPAIAEREQQPSTRTRSDIHSCISEHCILALDLRNAWPNPLSVTVAVHGHGARAITTSNSRSSIDSQVTAGREVTDEVQPGHVSRILLIVPRIYLENPYREIPAVDPSNRRQFVISANRLSPEIELASRQAFWYREEILKHIRGAWREESTGREGMIEMRDIRLNPRMIEDLLLDDIDFSFAIEPLTPEVGDTGHTEHTDMTVVSNVGRSHFAVKTNTFLTLTVTVFNRSTRPIHPVLRLQPCLRHQSHTFALELTRRLSWTGMLQRGLPVLQGGGIVRAKLGVTALCRGEYEIGASVEEARLIKPSESATASSGDTSVQGVSGESGQKPPAASGFPFRKQRRIWHSRSPCIISAHD